MYKYKNEEWNGYGEGKRGERKELIIYLAIAVTYGDPC